jgi:hypothetical protein
MLAACTQNPDPRQMSLEVMQKGAHGAWIQLVAHDGRALGGELLAIDASTIWVETLDRQTLEVDRANVAHGNVYTYVSEGGMGVWGLFGTLSTISHGFFFLFTAPIWLISSSIAAGAEASHVELDLEDETLDDIAKWARYPQGMPIRVAKPVARPPGSEAWQLTKQAQDAAREGRCDAVAELDARVRALDPELHERTFLRDEAIRRCFGLPSLLAPPSSVAPSTQSGSASP